MSAGVAERFRRRPAEPLYMGSIPIPGSILARQTGFASASTRYNIYPLIQPRHLEYASALPRARSLTFHSLLLF